jgi:hypothetical protein
MMVVEQPRVDEARSAGRREAGWRLDRLTPAGALILLAAMANMIRRWADYDIFWHLANGRLMVDQGVFPSPDHFSWSMTNHLYVAYSAQIDRIYYLLWQVGDAPALGSASTLVFALVLLPFALLAGRLAARPLALALALIVIAFALLPFRGARPHVVAFGLFGLIAYLLERPFGNGQLFLVGMTLGVWANVHGTFQVGYGLVGVAVCSWLLAGDIQSATRAGLALAVGFGLSLFSPYGPHLWLYPFQTVSNPYLGVNEEWGGLRPLTLLGSGMGLLLATALSVGIWRPTEPRSLAAIGLALLSIQLVRFTPFAAPLLGFVVLERLVERVPRLRLKVEAGPPAFGVTASRRSGIAAWSLLLVGAPLIGLGTPGSLEAAAFEPMPQQAVDKLLACGSPAPIWNDYNWGGYLVWRGNARYPVGIDGRAETLYSNQVFLDYLRVWQGRDGWKEIVQRSPAKYALLRRDAATRIDKLPGWRQVFRDDVATLSVRDGAVWRCPD